MTHHEHPEIRAWLAERNYSEVEIATILERLEKFDARISRESLFDAMTTGEVDLESIVRDVLKDARD